MTAMYDTVQKFTKYVKFLSNHFEINVEFDSANCERKDNTIYLPTLNSMSQAEIDILWGVLLQEAGFLKHGGLKDDAVLLKLKTQNHAKMCRLIEAARIEQKLMSQFDGAQDMLDPLYEQCIEDNNLKSKFYPESTYSDAWAGLCYYAHQKLMNKDAADIQSKLAILIPKKTELKKLNSFIKDSDIDKIIDSGTYALDKSSTVDSSLKLANKLHTMFFAGKDLSPAIDYQKTLNLKKKAEAAAQAAQARFEQLQKELQKQEARLQELRDKAREERKKIEQEFRPLQEKKNAAEDNYQKINRLIDFENKKEGMINSKNYNNTLVKTHKEKLDSVKEQIENIRQRLENQSNPQVESSEVSEKNKEVLEQMGFKDNFDLSSLEKKTDELQKKFDELSQGVKNQEAYSESLKAQEKLNDKMQKQAEQVKAAQSKLDDLLNKEKEMNAKYQKALAQNDNSEKSASNIEKLEQKIEELKEKIKNANEVKNHSEQKLSDTKEQIEQNQQTLSDNEFKNEEGKTAKQLEAQQMVENQELAQLKDQLKALNKEMSRHSIDDDKKAKLEAKKLNLESKMPELDKKIKDRQAKADVLEQQKNQLEQQAQSITQELGNPSAEQLEQMQKDALEQLNKAMQEVSKITEGLNKLKDNINQEMAQKGAKEQEAHKDVLKNAKQLQEMFEEMGIDPGLMPKFVPMEGWDEANDVQKSFDEKQSKDTGQFVTNGAGLDFSGKNTLSEIIDKINDVSEINVKDLFSSITSLNPLDNFSKGDEVSHLDSGNYSIGKSVRPFVAATKMYDTIETKNRLTDPVKIKEFQTIKTQLTGAIREVKNTVRQKFKFTKKPLYKGGKEEGDLDSRNMYKLATGLDDNYYEVNNPKFINKIAATIIIDMSGSGGKDYTDNGEKYLKLALLLSEGLAEAHIPHEIIAHGAPFSEEMAAQKYSDLFTRKTHRLQTIIYKKFEDKQNQGLGNFEIQSVDNCDGESLEIAYNRVKKRNEKNKIVFNIGDGKPFLSDAKVEVLDEDLRRVVRKITQDKNHIFALGFNDGPQELYGNRYKKIEKWTDLNDFLKSIDLNSNGLAVVNSNRPKSMNR